MTPGSPVIKLSAPEAGQFWALPVLWEDTRLLALDKPGGLLTSPDRYDPRRPNLITLLDRGIAHGTAWAKERRLEDLAHSNRLDFERSGVILFAKDKPTLIALANQFGAERPNKMYRALTCGAPPLDVLNISAKLSADPAQFGLVRVDSRNGRKARTLVEVAERFAGYSLLKCQAITDRPHQIRAHLSHERVPLVGDSKDRRRPLLLSQLKGDD